MNQKKPKQSNLTHNQQQEHTTNFSLPCPQPDKFWKSIYQRNRFYLLEHFEDDLHFLSIYNSSR